jgi:hypothetical protein
MDLSEQLLSCIHEIRTTAGRNTLLSRLRSRLTFYSGKNYNSNGTTKVTKEGKIAVNDCISYLQNKDNYHFDDDDSSFNLSPQRALCLSAQDHAYDIGSGGIVSHVGSDDSSPSERMNRYTIWTGACTEVIWYGRLSIDSMKEADKRIIAMSIIDDLMVDDGVSDRGHRLALYDSRFRVGGAAVYTHSIFGNVVVVNLVANVLEYEQSKDAKISSLMKSEKDDEEEDWLLRQEQLREKMEAMQIREKDGPPPIHHSASNTKTSSSCSSQWQLGHCFVCSQDIKGGRVMEFKGQKCHFECFLCCQCHKSLKGVPFQVVDSDHGDKWTNSSRSSTLVCQQCYDDTHAPICPHCNDRITEKKRVKFKEALYHVDCYETLQHGTARTTRGRGTFRTGGGRGRQTMRGRGSTQGRSMGAARNELQSIIGDYSDLL